jgi:hypothetical protein
VFDGFVGSTIACATITEQRRGYSARLIESHCRHRDHDVHGNGGPAAESAISERTSFGFNDLSHVEAIQSKVSKMKTHPTLS